MAYKLRLTESARTDLDEILSYMVTVLDNRPAASSFMRLFEDKLDALRHTPYICELVSDADLRVKGYRRMVIQNFLALYSVNEMEKMVSILRVFHGRRDWLELL